jgi:hypothetical protein
MNKGEELVRVYTGTEVAVLILRGELEDIGVGSVVQNDYVSGISVGIIGGTPTSVDLFIQQSDLEKAGSVISEFILKNN